MSNRSRTPSPNRSGEESSYSSSEDSTSVTTVYSASSDSSLKTRGNKRANSISPSQGQLTPLHSSTPKKEINSVKMSSPSRSSSSKESAINFNEIDNLVAGRMGTYDAKVIELFSYSGFSPLVVRTILKSKEENPSTFIKDMGTLIMVFLLRGSKISKMLRKMPEKGASIVQDLVTKYGVSDTGVEMTSKTVTLPRLAACFPESTAKALFNTRTPITYPPGVDPNFPRALMNPGMAAIIPSNFGDLTTALLDAHMEYCILFDAMINPNKRTPGDKLKQFQQSTFRSTALNDEQRATLCEDLELLVMVGEDLIIIESLKRFMPRHAAKRKIAESKSPETPKKSKRSQAGRGATGEPSNLF